MARSSYKESQSRTAVIFWSNALFVLGIVVMASTVGAIGPLFFNESGTPIAPVELLLSLPSLSSVRCGSPALMAIVSQSLWEALG
jgi:hypothetical protein